ncbi:MAG: pilus assembly PilX family protein, partial [Planctomycetota bacterium]
MSHRTSPPAAACRSTHCFPARRRGVSSVLAMMFLIIFGSLAAAMAVVAQGNLRTADSAMKVSRAMSAAETGLVFATRRLAEQSNRFVVEKGVIDADYGKDLWEGTFDEGADGIVIVLPPDGYSEPSEPAGVAEALLFVHDDDAHSIDVEPGDGFLPAIDGFGTLRVKPVALTANPDGTPSVDGPYFRLKYELLQDVPYVRVTSQGVDGDITRTLQMDFLINKRIEYAIIAPSRIMIGKNVRVEGPLGSRYGTVDGELDSANGDPLVMRSDFYYLNNGLDNQLDSFFTQLAAHDADGDGRLRLYHPQEQLGIAADPGNLVDHDQNEYVDDFDLFLGHFDADGDGWVVYDSGLTNDAGLGPMSEEFLDIDDQMARLIDDALPDRDGDGLVTDSDVALGYHDGVLDVKDLYAKVRGELMFAVTSDEWELAHGESYQTVVQGVVLPGLDEAAVTFSAGEEELREVTTDMFNASQTWFEAQVPAPGGPDFQNQVDQGITDGGTFTPPGAATWESIPHGAPGAYDYYQRPIYEDMRFENVRIPMGTNGLFKNCTFVGVTFIDTDPDCAHENWNYAGALEKVQSPPDSDPPTYIYEPKYPGVVAEHMIDGMPVPDTKLVSNNIRFESCTFIGSIAGVKPDEYTHWRNKVQLTGETRFYVDADDPDLADQPDAAEIVAEIGAMNVDTLEELRKSSILMPGWSADMGNFANEQAADPEDTPKVKLKGTIVAGILDIRGTADLFGTLLMTFRPTADEGPLFYGGLTDAFNTTIGYFGPSDGDGEGTDDAADFGFG